MMWVIVVAGGDELMWSISFCSSVVFFVRLQRDDSSFHPRWFFEVLMSYWSEGVGFL